MTTNSSLDWLIVVGPVVTVEKPERFARRLFQAAVEIIKRKPPKATFSDFHGCGSFHRPLPSFFFTSLFVFEPPLQKLARISHQDRL
jgi:hypothetical protein